MVAHFSPAARALALAGLVSSGVCGGAIAMPLGAPARLEPVTDLRLDVGYRTTRTVVRDVTTTRVTRQVRTVRYVTRYERPVVRYRPRRVWREEVVVRRPATYVYYYPYAYAYYVPATTRYGVAQSYDTRSGYWGASRSNYSEAVGYAGERRGGLLGGVGEAVGGTVGGVGTALFGN